MGTIGYALDFVLNMQDRDNGGNDFVLNMHDRDNGGISDRPDNAVDVFHAFFGVAGVNNCFFSVI